MMYNCRNQKQVHWKRQKNHVLTTIFCFWASISIKLFANNNKMSRWLLIACPNIKHALYRNYILCIVVACMIRKHTFLLIWPNLFLIKHGSFVGAQATVKLIVECRANSKWNAIDATPQYVINWYIWSVCASGNPGMLSCEWAELDQVSTHCCLGPTKTGKQEKEIESTKT